jgi:hypothetical protein
VEDHEGVLFDNDGARAPPAVALELQPAELTMEEALELVIIYNADLRFSCK